MTRDLRRYARSTNRRLLIGGILILFVVGDSLIYMIYGRNAAIMGLVCLTGGIAPLVLIWVILKLMEWIVKRVDQG